MAADRSRQGKNNVKSLPTEYCLRLFVTGSTARSSRSLRSLRTILEKYLKGRAELEVIDIYQQPGLAREAQILAAPTLIKERPLPVRRLVGELTDIGRVLVALGITGSVPQ
jgi:circadian clock protein KaiB